MSPFAREVSPEGSVKGFKLGTSRHGYFGAMLGFAAALGPSLGGFLVHHFGWKSIFLMNVPPLVLSVLLSGPGSAASLSRYHLAILVFSGSFALAAVVSAWLPGPEVLPRMVPQRNLHRAALR